MNSSFNIELCAPGGIVTGCVGYNMDSGAYYNAGLSIGPTNILSVDLIGEFDARICMPIPFINICKGYNNDGPYNIIGLGIGKFLNANYIMPICSETDPTFSSRLINTGYIDVANSMLNKMSEMNLNMERTKNNLEIINKTIEAKAGVSAGDESCNYHATIIPSISTTSTISNIMFSYDTTNCSISYDNITCNMCGQSFNNISTLRKYKLYWCQLCNISRVFSPFNPMYFGPFESEDEYTAIIEYQQQLYKNHTGFWRN